MRRGFHTAVWSGLLAVAPLCAAQYHGGFVSTPGRIPMGAPHIHVGPPQNFGGRMITRAPQFVMPYVAPMRGAGGSTLAQHGGREIWRGRDRNDRHGHGYRGYAGYVPFGYVNAWSVLPPDDDYDYDYDESTAAPASQPQAGVNPSAPPPDEYRPPYESAEQNPYPAQPSRPAVSSTVLSQEPELTLVFRDGHRQSIRNFVLTPTTVIDLDQASTGRERRIPLAELDLAATEQSAQAAGLDFHPPA